MEERNFNLFGEEIIEGKISGLGESKKYTSKMNTPIYTPSNRGGRVSDLVDTHKSFYLEQAIRCSNVSDEEKRFLLLAAHRHDVFNYAKIADYYASASKEMQDLMERSALVIIDYDKAIENGFARLTTTMETINKEEMSNDEE